MKNSVSVVTKIGRSKLVRISVEKVLGASEIPYLRPQFLM